NIPGLYAIGEANYQYHGANRLGANSLLSCIFDGMFVAPGIDNYLKNLPAPVAADLPGSLFDREVRRHEETAQRMIRSDGRENPYELHRELGATMTRNCTVVRHNKDLRDTLARLDELDDRYRRVAVADKGDWTNQNFAFARALGDMLVLARVIAQGALARDECRGVHYKPECLIPSPTSDDPDELHREAKAWCEAFRQKNEKWLKSTIAEHTPEGPRITYESVDVSMIPPRPRTYGLKGAEVIEEVWKASNRRGEDPGGPQMNRRDAES
ncbi:MAG: FAD-binding protein, partial [Phycisphaerae bacterium]